MPKALGLNVGRKIGIARRNDHVSVAIFVGIGLLHLDEVAIGLGHRCQLGGLVNDVSTWYSRCYNCRKDEKPLVLAATGELFNHIQRKMVFR